MLLYGLGHGAEYDAQFGQFFLEGRFHTHRIDHHIHGHSAQSLLFFQADAQLVEGLEQLWVHLVEAVEFFLGLGCRIIGDGVKIGWWVLQVGPVGLLHFLPLPVAVQSPFRHPFRLVLFGRYEPNDLFIQTIGRFVRIDVGGEAVGVF